MKERNYLIDFWRGVVLMMITINHVPKNLIEHLTSRNFGFSDSAEAFVFISGFSVALAFFPKILKGDWSNVVKRCFKRSITIYGVHIFITLLSIILYSIAYELCQDQRFITDHGRRYVFDETPDEFFGILFLGHQLGYFNILPLYILLMIAAPFLLLLIRKNLPWAFYFSLSIWFLARFGYLNLYTWPAPGKWFFNPFSWQLIFVLGMIAGCFYIEKKEINLKPFIPLCGIILFISFITIWKGFSFFPNFFETTAKILDITKGYLGAGRLIHFLALATCLIYFLPAKRIERIPGYLSIQKLGRHSLTIFAISSLLSASGQIFMILVENFISHNKKIISISGAFYTLIILALLFFIADYLEKLRLQKQNSALQTAPLNMDQV